MLCIHPHVPAARLTIGSELTILLPITPEQFKPTNYNSVAMGAIRLIGLISVRN